MIRTYYHARTSFEGSERMRGGDEHNGGMFSYVTPEARVRPDHPLRPIRRMTDAVASPLLGVGFGMPPEAGRGTGLRHCRRIGSGDAARNGHPRHHGVPPRAGSADRQTASESVIRTACASPISRCRQKSLTLAWWLAMLRGMRHVVRALTAIRFSLATRRDMLLDVLALRHQLAVLVRSYRRFRRS